MNHLYRQFVFLFTAVFIALFLGSAHKAEAANVSTIFSVSVWVRPVSSVVSKALVIKNDEIRLITDGSSKFACQIHNGAAWQTGATSTDALSLNTWQHLTCTYDRSNIKVYINGVEKGSQAMSNVDIQDTANAWNYGKDEAGSYGYFAGRMDDIQIYNYALTPKQIMQVMNVGHPAVGSPVGSYVGYWKFDEMQGTTAYDQSINQNNLTLSSASWTTATDCKFAGCWQGADNKRITRADDADFDFAAADDFSVAVWFKRNTISTISNAEYLLHKQAGFEGYAIYLDASGDVIFGIGDTNSTAFPEESIGNIGRDYDDNAWHLATAVKTSNSRIDLYVDGVLIASDTSLTTDADLTNSGKLIIGDQDEADGTDEFLGSIDEAAIYRFALSPAEIKQLYNQGASLSLGAKSTVSDGSTPSDSKSREYCIPGDTSTCNPPVLHIKMDEKTGDTAFDTSGNGNNGDLAGTCPGGATCPTWKSAASCHEGACLSFDGGMIMF